MNVLVLTRPELYNKMTGDVVQIYNTTKALKKFGVKVNISDTVKTDITDYDIIHLFSTHVPHYNYLRIIFFKNKVIPVVVSPIYWEWKPDELKRETIFRIGYTGYLTKKIFSWMLKKAPGKIRYILERPSAPYNLQRRFYQLEKQVGLMEMRKYIYENAEVLLPNSHIEYKYLNEKFGINNTYIAVPNAVDPCFAEGNAKEFKKKYGLENFILCCAIIHERKNHIRLIRAMKRIDHPLVLIGARAERYTRRCMNEAPSNVYFLGELRGKDLINAYAAAKVHALVSFFETPGLASLEAALADNVIVVTERGCTREYFQNEALYCDPNSVESIRKALEKALTMKPSTQLRERIQQNYTWENAAQKTYEGYKLALEKMR